jgi:tRNA pseudouridine55 synthase
MGRESRRPASRVTALARPAALARGGVLLIDKPAGLTSHDVVARLRRVLGTRRVGHAGTLDPAATGVLVVAFDLATRLLEYLVCDTKTYSGVFRFGVTTDTDDADGTVRARLELPSDIDARVAALLPTFRGSIQQVPPRFSALHVDGVRAHALARAGAAVDLAPRAVCVDALEVGPVMDTDAAFTASVSSGTYIRSLARDLGVAVGCGAHLFTLRRTRSGRYGIGDCVGLDALTSGEVSLRAPWTLSLPEAVAHLPTLEVDDTQVADLGFGRALRWPSGVEASSGPIAAVHGEELVAIGAHQADGNGGLYRPSKVFAGS